MHSNRQRRVLLTMGKHYGDRIHHGVAHHAGQAGWHLTNVFGSSPDLIRNRETDGIIAVLEKNDPLSESIIRKRIPTVDLSIARHRLGMPHLTGDNHSMGQTAAQHFLERGFQHFLWYADKNHAAATLRQNGFQSTLSTHGYTLNSMIVE